MRGTGILNKKNIIIAFFSIIIAGCATYYHKNIKFQEYVLNGNFTEAKTTLESNKKAAEGKNKILYYFNHGWVTWMLKDYKTSIANFAEADKIIEDQSVNIGLEALALITNQNVKPYNPEDFEKVMLNYYMAMNYLQLNQYDEAIVECKRINIKLNKLNDKYKDNKNRYQSDAFAHTLMGLIYDANKDYNNAFIAYRNALETYENIYVKNFNMVVPEQLKQDILRTAYLTGFHDEVDYYEKKFNLKYKHEKNEGGELILFWENGFGPVKTEWSINFTTIPGDAGWVTFTNDEFGISYPFYIGDKSDDEKSALKQLKFFRVAFPKYLERKPFYNSASVYVNNRNYKLELAENVNEIAFKTLRDRMMREMGNALLRLATKKALEKAAESKKDQQIDAGTVLNWVNTATEQADTRNWQTLPYSISYARIPLPEGENTLELKSYNGSANAKSETLKFNITKGKTCFFAYHNLESLPLGEYK